MAKAHSRKQEPNLLQVFIFKEGRFFGSECFVQSQIVMGRSPDVDLMLDDDITSRTHATVELQTDGIVLEDLASSNGTFVNGEPVERCYISARDEVSIGTFTLKFKQLAHSPKKSEFVQETRLVDRNAHESLSSAKQEPAPEVINEQQAKAASALADELGRNEFNGAPQAASSGGIKGHRSESRQAPPQDKQLFGTQEEDLGPGLDDLLGPAPGPASSSQRDSSHRDSSHRDSSRRDSSRRDSSRRDPSHRDPSYRDPSYRDPSHRDPSHRDPSYRDPSHRDSSHRDSSHRDSSHRDSSRRDSSRRDSSRRDSSRRDSSRRDSSRRDSSYRDSSSRDRLHESDLLFDNEDDQEEFELKDFVEPFSLLNNLIRENFAHPNVPTLSQPVMEIIGYTSDKAVTDYTQLTRGRKHRTAEKDVMVHFRGRDAGRLFFTDEYSGGIISDGVTIPLEDLKDSRHSYSRRRGSVVYAYNLNRGDYANVIHPGGGSFVRFVNPPEVHFPRSRFTLNPTDIKIFSSSFVAVVFCIILVGTFYKGNEAVANQDLDMFAKIDIKDIQMEQPEEEVEIPLDQLPPPEPEPEPETKPEPEPEPKPKPKPKKREKKKQPAKRQRPRKAAKQAAAQNESDAGGDPGAGAGMMAALGNLNQKKSSKNIVAAVTNLDAVRVPGGRSRYKVSGLVTKLPTSSVVTSRGRGLGVKGGIELLRGGKGRRSVGALGGGKTGKRGVGGVVFNAPKRKMRVQGTLSREAIASVVRKHLREIQYCYEKNLMKNPSLTGKLMMEWTITTSGSVSVVKTKQNTMATPAVAMCVSSNIKGWRFPQPKGGIVVVSYPFIFNSIGF